MSLSQIATLLAFVAFALAALFGFLAYTHEKERQEKSSPRTTGILALIATVCLSAGWLSISYLLSQQHPERMWDPFGVFLLAVGAAWMAIFRSQASSVEKNLSVKEAKGTDATIMAWVAALLFVASWVLLATVEYRLNRWVWMFGSLPALMLATHSAVLFYIRRKGVLPKKEEDAKEFRPNYDRYFSGEALLLRYAIPAVLQLGMTIGIANIIDRTLQCCDRGDLPCLTSDCPDQADIAASGRNCATATSLQASPSAPAGPVGSAPRILEPRAGNSAGPGPNPTPSNSAPAPTASTAPSGTPPLPGLAPSASVVALAASTPPPTPATSGNTPAPVTSAAGVTQQLSPSSSTNESKRASGPEIPPSRGTDNVGWVSRCVRGAACGLIGAYTYVLLLLGRRMFRMDITPGIANWCTVVITIGPTLAAFLGPFILDKTPGSPLSDQEVQVAFLFLAGFSPRFVVETLEELGGRLFAGRGSATALPTRTVPLTQIRGISRGDEERLQEEGIEDASQLAAADPFRLLRNTSYDKRLILQWMDSALLMSLLPETYAALERRGVPGAMALVWHLQHPTVAVADETAEKDTVKELADAARLDVGVLRAVATRLSEDPQYRIVKTLYDHNGHD